MYFLIQDENQEITLKNVEHFIKLWIFNNRIKINSIHSHLKNKIIANINLVINKNIYFKYDMATNSRNEIKIQDIDMYKILQIDQNNFN